MKIEEYIKLRKTQDKMNEYDIENKISNLHQTIDYVFEFFTTYVNIDAQQQRQIEKNEKINRYQRQLTDYSLETQNWILHIYATHGNRISSIIRHCLHDDMVFQLLTEPSQIRKVTFQAYAKIEKKYPYIEDFTEELYQFIDEHHKIMNFDYRLDLDDETRAHLPEEVISFVEKTRRTQHIDLMSWADNYAFWFSNQESIWPKSHILLPDGFSSVKHSYPTYNLRVKKNRFNLDTFYMKLGELRYLRNKKKHLTTLIMYFWLKKIDDSDEAYYPIFVKEAGFKL